MNINLTLLGQTITFLIFVWFSWKFIWPALIGVMEAREKKIEDGLQAAERADKDLELAQKKATEQLHEAKVQAASIVEQATKRANQIVEEAKAQARVEGDRIKVAAQAEIEQEANRAKEVLRGQVASLALLGAEKVLGSSVDASQHSKLVDQLAAEL